MSILDMLKTRIKNYLNTGIMEENVIFYIGGSQSLPPPLPADEEEKMIKKLNNNDFQARQVLVEHNLRLVVYIAKKFENTGIGIEDLVSIGTIGLMKAINTFNAGKNIKLATYASRCIENEILMLIRSNKKHKETISLNTILAPKNDSDDLELANLIPSESEEDVFQQVEVSCVMLEVMKIMDKNLSYMEKEILKYRYGLCNYPVKTQKEVADIFGISRSYISRIENKIIKILRKNISKENNDEKKLGNG